MARSDRRPIGYPFWMGGGWLAVASVLALAGSPAPPDPQTPDDATVLAALCPGKKKCRVVERKSAGRDAEGLDLVVATVRVREARLTSSEGGFKRRRPCPREPVGVFRLRGGVVVSHDPIMVLFEESRCEYGVNDGEENIWVEPGRATFDITSGTAWHWRNKKVWALSPRVTLLISSHDEWNHFEWNEITEETDHVGGRTEVSWWAPTCDQKDDDENEAAGPKSESDGHRYLVIPRTHGAAAEARWQTDVPGLRWLNLDASGKAGYIVHGQPGQPEESRMRVGALSETTLLLDVQDDVLVPAAKRWIHADHLEIWGTDLLPSWSECLARGPRKGDTDEPTVGSAWQWGVMLDGSIQAGVGRPPAAPTVAVAEVTTTSWGKVRRFRIEMPPQVKGLSVLYSDSDDGTNQERILGTSRLRFKDPASLGRIEEAKESAP